MGNWISLLSYNFIAVNRDCDERYNFAVHFHIHNNLIFLHNNNTELPVITRYCL